MPKNQTKRQKQLNAVNQVLTPAPNSLASAAENLPEQADSSPIQRRTTRSKAGAPKGNRNAAKVGEDLRLEMYLSKYKRAFFEQYFEFKFGRSPKSENELRETFRQIAYAALDRAIVEELERHNPGSVLGSSGETF